MERCFYCKMPHKTHALVFAGPVRPLCNWHWLKFSVEANDLAVQA